MGNVIGTTRYISKTFLLFIFFYLHSRMFNNKTVHISQLNEKKKTMNVMNVVRTSDTLTGYLPICQLLPKVSLRIISLISF